MNLILDKMSRQMSAGIIKYMGFANRGGGGRRGVSFWSFKFLIELFPAEGQQSADLNRFKCVCQLPTSLDRQAGRQAGQIEQDRPCAPLKGSTNLRTTTVNWMWRSVLFPDSACLYDYILSILANRQTLRAINLCFCLLTHHIIRSLTRSRHPSPPGPFSAPSWQVKYHHLGFTTVVNCEYNRHQSEIAIVKP